MNFLLRLAGSYVDAVLATFYPLQQEPSMADVYANQLADKEAEEEVGTGGRVCRDDVWPETPDPIDHMIALLEDIRNLVSSAVSPEAAASPDSVEPPAESGHPDLTEGELSDLGKAARSFAGDCEWIDPDKAEYWRELSHKAWRIAHAAK